ncbi:amidohydrolase family protein [Bradyrhizobium sp. ISRA442]|uniref:amidohydrolase family protein n=1 Tax=Bradyrhizobium sp. ISRA442 TaxID=2866197 RepID=UPI00311AC50E
MNNEESAVQAEPIIEPDLVICDAHHHLWDMAEPVWPFSDGKLHYLLPELLADVFSGHRVESTIYNDAGSFFRAIGPEHLKCVGETEFVNGVAAMTASGRYGPVRACEAIVGNGNLTAGALVADILEAQIRAGNGRFKGIRHLGAYDPAPEFTRYRRRHAAVGLYDTPDFRDGFAKLCEFDLTFDAAVYHTQIGEVTRLADAFPNAPIVLNHVGLPLGYGPYAGKQGEVFAVWKPAIEDLARRENVHVKLGGLGLIYCGFGFWGRKPKPRSEELAAAWGPYIKTCIEAFGARRSMFESNFPVDYASCDYATLWNAFKRIAAGASADEKAWLFNRTARSFYRLG